MQVLSERTLNRATLARQLLLERAHVPVVEAVSRLAGLQAQLARPPFVGLWSRVGAFARTDLVNAAVGRDVVRSTLMRGTIHLVSRDDFTWMRPAVQPALTAGMQAILKDRVRGMDLDALLAAAREVYLEEPCTFARLRERLAARFPSLDERAMGYAVRMHLPLVQVPVEGAAWGWPGNADFALADRWLSGRARAVTTGKRPAREEGVTDRLVLSYLAAFGPASARDFQTWSYLPEGAAAVERLRHRLAVFRDSKGRDLFDHPDAPRPSDEVPAPVRFLPEYDNLLLAYADRTRVVAEPHRKAMVTRNLVQPATLLVDGTVAGTWTVAVRKRVATLAIAPFVAIPRSARQEIEEEGERLLEFLEPGASARTIEIGTRRLAG